MVRATYRVTTVAALVLGLAGACGDDDVRRFDPTGGIGSGTGGGVTTVTGSGGGGGGAVSAAVDVVVALGPTAQSRVEDVAVASDGSIYVAGYFEDRFELDGTVVQLQPGERACFFVKLDGSGQLQWVQTFGAIAINVETSEEMNLASTDDGGVILTGSVRTASQLDPDDASTLIQPSNGLYWDIFVARFTADGAVVWLQSDFADEAVRPALRDVAVGSDGSVWVAGDSEQTPLFGLPAPSEFFTFAARFDLDTGDVQGVAFQPTAFTATEGNAIAAAPDGTALLGATFSVGLTAGGGELTTTDPLDNDAALVRLDAVPTDTAAFRYGGATVDDLEAVAFTADGDWLVAGATAGVLDFGGNAVATSADRFDAFVARVGDDGIGMWATTIGTQGQSRAWAMVRDASAVLVGGFFTGTLGGTDSPTQNLFVAGFDVDSGAREFVLTLGGDGSQALNALDARDGTFAFVGDNDGQIADIDSGGVLEVIVGIGTYTP